MEEIFCSLRRSMTFMGAELCTALGTRARGPHSVARVGVSGSAPCRQVANVPVDKRCLAGMLIYRGPISFRAAELSCHRGSVGYCSPSQQVISLERRCECDRLLLSGDYLQRSSRGPILPNEQSDHPHVPGSFYDWHSDLAVSQPGKTRVDGWCRCESGSDMAHHRLTCCAHRRSRQNHAVADINASPGDDHELATRDDALFRRAVF